MLLETYEQRQNERRKKEKKLSLLRDGERLKIDKQELEQLLFETRTIEYNGAKVTLKYPVWSGSFLKKIDLSEISFEDVCWSWGVLWDIVSENKELKNEVDLEFKRLMERIYYSGTNARIDLKKSADFKYPDSPGSFSLSYCDFSGTDLSCNELNFDDFSQVYIRECNFNNTKLKIKGGKKPCINRLLQIHYTDLGGVDCSEFDCNFANIVDSNFSGSGLNAYFSLSNVQEFLKKYPELYEKLGSELYTRAPYTNPYDKWDFEIDNQTKSDWYKCINPVHKFIKGLRNGHLYGCKINGKMINYPEENLLRRVDLRDEYNIPDNSETAIERQIAAIIRNRR